MRSFDHIGIPTAEKRAGERFVQLTRVWVTDPHLHPFSVEWLRYEDGGNVAEALRKNPHIAFRVDNIEAESAGLETIISPFSSIAGHVVGFYRTPDGAIVELMMFDD